TANH
ncbi:hypothetical protein D049_2970B, partial [Vibrio parahaemolyticus VPTS-2010]